MDQNITLYDTDTALLTIRGRLDASSASELKTTLLNNHQLIHLTLDLAAITHLDTIGITALITTLQTLRQRGGTLTLTNPSDTVINLLRYTGADRSFVIKSSLNASLNQRLS